MWSSISSYISFNISKTSDDLQSVYVNTHAGPSKHQEDKNLKITTKNMKVAKLKCSCLADSQESIPFEFNYSPASAARRGVLFRRLPDCRNPLDLVDSSLLDRVLELFSSMSRFEPSSSSLGTLFLLLVPTPVEPFSLAPSPAPTT